MKLIHPSRNNLLRWLDGDDDDPKLDAHVATCRRCATTIEEFDHQQQVDIANALALALQPPDNLYERLEERVAARLDSRVMLGVLSDLFGAGVETSRMLIMEETEDE